MYDVINLLETNGDIQSILASLFTQVNNNTEFADILDTLIEQNENLINDTGFTGKSFETNLENYTLPQDLLQDVVNIREEFIKEFDLSKEVIKFEVSDNSNINPQSIFEAFKSNLIRKFIPEFKENSKENQEGIASSSISFEDDFKETKFTNFQEKIKFVLEQKNDNKQNQNQNISKQIPKEEKLNTEQHFFYSAPKEVSNVIEEETPIQSSITKQVIEKIEIKPNEPIKIVKFQLNPQNLGEVKIEIKMDENGFVSAKFNVQNTQVKQTLEKDIQLLLQRFEQQDIKVSNIEINVGLDSINQINYQKESKEQKNQKEKTSKKGTQVKKKKCTYIDLNA